MTVKKRELVRGTDAGAGRFAYDGLDRALHEKARLGVLTSLVAHPDGLRFNELRAMWLAHRRQSEPASRRAP